MPTTAKGLRYPAESDTADVPRDMQNLASDVDTKFLGYNPTDVPINSAAKLVWGGDTNLYRSAAKVVQTDGEYRAIGAAAGSNAFTAQVTGDTQVRFVAAANGFLSWGPGNAAVDVNLYRNAPGQIQTDAILYIKRAVGATAFGVGPFGSEAQPRFYMDSNGKLNWGDGTAFDLGLARSSSGILQVIGTLALGNPADTILYRRSASSVETNSHLIVDGNVYVGSTAADVYFFRGNSTTMGCNVTIGANLGAGPQALMGNISGNNVPTFQLGNSLDCGFHRGGGNSMNCWGNTWEVLNASAFTVQSDRNTKSDEERVEPDWHEQLLGAGIYSYRRDDTDERHLGMMADELPDVVLAIGRPLDGKIDGEEHQMVDLYKLTTALLATVQHLNERLSALEA